MSWNASGWAKRCRLGSPVRKAVLLVLADYATEDASQFDAGFVIPDGWAVAWPAIKTIADDAEVSRSTAYDVLRWMEEAHVVGREQRFDGSGRQKTSGYWIEWAREPVRLAGVRDLDPEGPGVGREGPGDGPTRVRGAGPKPSRGTVKRTHTTADTPSVGNGTPAGRPQVFHNPDHSQLPGGAAAPSAPASPDEIRRRALGASRGRRQA